MIGRCSASSPMEAPEPPLHLISRGAPPDIYWAGHQGWTPWGTQGRAAATGSGRGASGVHPRSGCCANIRPHTGWKHAGLRRGDRRGRERVGAGYRFGGVDHVCAFEAPSVISECVVIRRRAATRFAGRVTSPHAEHGDRRPAQPGQGGDGRSCFKRPGVCPVRQAGVLRPRRRGLRRRASRQPCP